MTEPAQTLSEETLERVWDALSNVYDPEIPINIVDLGLVRNIEGDEDSIIITMILTAPFCPLADMILEQARAAAQAVVEQSVYVNLGTERWDPSMMKEQGREQLGTG
ncbi:MAG: metal-sulfur cluster assembly factor [Anaerolineae bacterium]|nr:metal-sulfur cluster assembly factor [Anaerolineae bacterium]